MGKFDGVLLASDFDNTLLNTETARRTGACLGGGHMEGQDADGRPLPAEGKLLQACLLYTSRCV